MKDRGIGMTPGNREAIVEGRKTMTRRGTGLAHINAEPDRWRVASFKAGIARFVDKKDGTVVDIEAPYTVGQRLYIREPYYHYGKWLKNGLTKTGKPARLFVASTNPEEWLFEKPDFARPMDYTDYEEGWYLRSPLFMPKKFARTWLLVTDVKAPERGKDIREEDAIKEGICETGKQLRVAGHLRKLYPSFGHAVTCLSAVASFGILLESIYGVGAMEKWYWPIEFKEVEVTHG